jgi:hypothetical protein
VFVVTSTFSKVSIFFKTRQSTICTLCYFPQQNYFYTLQLFVTQNPLAYLVASFTEIGMSVAPYTRVVCDNQPHCTIINRYYWDLCYKLSNCDDFSHGWVSKSVYKWWVYSAKSSNCDKDIRLNTICIPCPFAMIFVSSKIFQWAEILFSTKTL